MSASVLGSVAPLSRVMPQMAALVRFIFRKPAAVLSRMLCFAAAASVLGDGSESWRGGGLFRGSLARVRYQSSARAAAASSANATPDALSMRGTAPMSVYGFARRVSVSRNARVGFI